MMFVNSQPANARHSVNWHLLALLRFFLACVVVGVHVEAFIPGGIGHYLSIFGGKPAVLAFFLVSGFSIAASIQKCQNGFMLRRLLRIYPMYFGAFLLTLACQAIAVHAMDQPTYPADSIGRTIGNLLMTQMFLVKALSYNGPFWSLSLEVFYYFLTPLFVLLRRSHLFAIIAISGAVFLLPANKDWGTAYELLIKFNALKYIWAWLIGFCLYRETSTRWQMIGFIVCAGIFSASIHANHYATYITVLGTYLLLHVSHTVTLPRSWNKTFNYLGDLSYPLYLIHYPIIIAVGIAYEWKSDWILYPIIFLTASAFIIVFDGPIKKHVFRPFFTALLSATWIRKFLRFTPDHFTRCILVNPPNARP